MPIKGSVLKTGASACTVTGGTDMTFSSTGVTVANGVNVSNAANADFITRENITAKSRMPVQIGGSWKKGKYSATLVLPRVYEGDTEVKYNLVRVEVEPDPRIAAADLLDLRLMGAQMLFDADFSNLFIAGSLD